MQNPARRAKTPVRPIQQLEQSPKLRHVSHATAVSHGPPTHSNDGPLLLAEGRMHPSGTAELERARADGRSEAAYAGSATSEVPPDLAVALAAEPRANELFGRLSRRNRYAILYRIGNGKRAETRERRIRQFVEMLARGETLHPQERS